MCDISCIIATSFKKWVFNEDLTTHKQGLSYLLKMSVSLNKALNTVFRLHPVLSLIWSWVVQDFSGSSWAVLAVVSLGIAHPAFDKGSSNTLDTTEASSL